MDSDETFSHMSILVNTSSLVELSSYQQPYLLRHAYPSFYLCRTCPGLASRLFVWLLLAQKQFQVLPLRILRHTSLCDRGQMVVLGNLSHIRRLTSILEFRIFSMYLMMMTTTTYRTMLRTHWKRNFLAKLTRKTPMSRRQRPLYVYVFINSPIN
jgi:hypothetical protein